MPFVAKITRGDRFRTSDSREIKRWSAHRGGGRAFGLAGWREESGYRLFYFSTRAKARAMQHWIDRSGIAHRPMPTPYSGPQLGVGNGG